MRTSYGSIFKRTTIVFPREVPGISVNPFERLNILSLRPLSLDHRFTTFTGFTGLISCEGNFIDRFPERVIRYIRSTIKDAMDVRSFDSIPHDVYALYLAHSRERGFPAKPLRELDGCMAFCAYEEGNPISGMFVLPADPLLLLGIFSAGEQSKAAKRVMYEICRWGNEHGRTAVDVNKLEEKEGLPNEVFKRSFGTVVVPRYRYVYEPVLLRCISRFRSSVRNWKLHF